ncbi:TonB-dependent receptor [Sphingomonas sp.]|uniref:TonB-dependent receptor n=1 Tax=Sphingomonas sp. TaxID=28214 RepID=UPI001ECFB082|nr:TonB-dependent receptor [Sphingomonas sp.]MBX3595063.1 TonB-dependent receptor [Sphingomonas sp.]
MKRAIYLASSAVVLTLSATPALAQDAGAAAAPAPVQGDEIVVIGTPGGSGTSKQKASYAVTTISPDTLELAAPKSTAEVFTLVPGVWAESSGGVAGANIDVRGLPGGGDAPWVTFQINGAPIYGTQSLSFLEQSSIFRVDETIASTEAAHGGPNAVFSNGEVGVTMNFNLKKGGDRTTGRVKLGATDYGQYRADAVISGPLGEGFYYMLGGYVSRSPGIRDAQFTSEKGQQITAQLTKKLDNGEINLWTRWTDDHGQWYLPMALGTGNNLGTFSQLGNATRYESLRIDQNGTTETFDFARGRGWKGSVSGLNLNFDLGGGFSVRNNLSFTKGSADTLGFVPDGAPVTVAQLKAANGLTSVTTAGGATLGNAAYVQNYGHWVVTKDIQSLTNDISINLSSGGNDLTVGFYHAGWSSDDFWTLGNFRPVQNVANGDWLRNGITCGMLQNAGSGSGCWAYGIRSSGDATNNAIYLADSYEINDALRIDIGLRQSWLDINYLLDSGPGYPDGTTDLNVDRKASKFSYSGAVNYTVNSNLGFFARYSKGFRLFNFDDLRNGGGVAQVYSVDQIESGIKYRGDIFSAYLTGFLNHNDSFDSVVGGVSNGAFRTRAYGLEVDAAIHTGGFSFGALATLQNAKVTAATNTAIVGNEVFRQPSFQMRLSPSYEADLGGAKVTIYGAAQFVGERWSDLANTVKLPGYTKLDAGIEAKFNSGLFFRVAADNLNNSHGLTEGDPRAAGSNNGRPILGRSFTFNVGFDF